MATEHPPDGFVLRPMDTQDVEAVASIWFDAWGEAHGTYVPRELIAQRTRESFRIRLDDMYDTTTIAERNNRVLGFCSIKTDEIYQIYVHTAARGTGIAAALINDGEQRLRAAGTTWAFLDVIFENHRAIAFYRKQGWDEGSEAVAMLDTLGDPFPLRLQRMQKKLA